LHDDLNFLVGYINRLLRKLNGFLKERLCDAWVKSLDVILDEGACLFLWQVCKPPGDRNGFGPLVKVCLFSDSFYFGFKYLLGNFAYIYILEVRSASRPRLLAVAFGHRALLWPIFGKSIFFFG
jgi:hypothetical protein